LLDYWPLGRFNNKDQKSKLKILIEKLPFLAVSLLFGLVTVVAQRQSGALKTTTHFPVPARLANAILSYWEYLWQTIWPARLAVFYSYPKAFSLSGVAAVALLGVAALMLAFLAARKRPYLAFGSLWYLVTLLPVIGIIQVGSQSHADRYTYVPLIGVFVLLAWGASDLVRNRPARPAILTIAAALVLLPCLLLTHRQIGYWRDSETLYRHALAVTENNELAQNNLGTTLKRPGQEDEAIRHFQEAVRLAPDYALAYGNLGAALFSRGRLDESILASREAVRLKPDFAGAHRNLGAALGAKGHVDEAIFHLEQTVKLDPGDAQGHYNLGFAFLTKGRFDDAIAQFQETLRLKPDFTEAQRALQAALAAKEGKSPQRGH
jgi:tetratricopeptide (TPR) repeat protein